MIHSTATPFADVGQHVCPCYGDHEECICPPNEAGLRMYRGGHMAAPMTPAQREWCLGEIDAVEGYSRALYEREGDRELARGVLSAWADYVRDKGLL